MVEFSQPVAEAVGQSPSNLLENVPLVIVAKSPSDLIVSHVGSISVFPPESGKGLGIVETEETFLLILPADHVVVFRLLEDPQSELPELSRAWNVCTKGNKSHMEARCLLFIITQFLCE